MSKLEDTRTLAIIAHVDHGKTTLVDALFRQGGLFRGNQVVDDRILDTNDQERERGITILAKCTSVTFGNTRLQIVDTPGHSDFGGEVERTLRMVDGVLLLVDAAEGCLPQTRFVLRKSLELNLPAVVAINKIDRSDARPQAVLDEVYDLFINLGAEEDQLDFPVLYTVAKHGTATLDLAKPGKDLKPLVEALVATFPVFVDRSDDAFLMQVNQLAYDDYVGRLAIGRIQSGSVKTNQMVRLVSEAETTETRVTGIFTFQGIQRLPIPEAHSGDIVALSGIEDVSISDTLCDLEGSIQDIPTRICVEEPTVAMVFQVNDGPLAGQGGKTYLTSRHLRRRLFKESYGNPSIQVMDGETRDQFRVLGRGELQLAVLIESMRREDFELCVRSPEVVTRKGATGLEEPVERLVIDVEQAYMGAISGLLGPRKAKLVDHRVEGERVRLEYVIPTRGLFGLRSQMLTVSRGTALAHHVFDGWIPHTGVIAKRNLGALVADRFGTSTPYAIFHLEDRGTIFVGPQEVVYEGMIVGEHCRDRDLDVNICREKKLTNIRAANRDENVILTPPRKMSLEQCMEWIRDDEMIEITPTTFRMRKRVLAANKRQYHGVR